MRPLGTSALRLSRTSLICSSFLIFLLVLDADAGPSRHRKQAEFTVSLQPFSLVESAIHAVATPAGSNAPRVLKAAAVAPVQMAYYVPRVRKPRIPRAESIYEYEPGYDVENAETVRPIRVAYQVSRDVPGTRPDEASDEYDQDQDHEQEYGEEEEPAIERRGERPTVAGSRAVLRNGIAYAPSRAPDRVKHAIWAANSLRRKPYVWGGGHASFNDYGYDCSGSVSYALRGAGLLSAPIPSSDFLRYGERGRGRWITIYSRPGHTFAVIAGLRFDTTDMGHGGNVGPRWYADGRDMRGFQARHPAGL